MKKRNKIQPAVQTLNFATTGPEPGGRERTYVDLSQICSIVNRRFYRQGLNMAVAGFKISTAQPGTVFAYKLPNTWVTSNGWEKVFRAWNRQQKDVMEDAGGMSAMAKFRDFKVFMDTQHIDQFLAAGSDLNATNLMPIDSTGIAATGGEWQPSRITLPNTSPVNHDDPTSVYLHVVGPNHYAPLGTDVSRGIIEGYADSRAYPQSPDPVSPDLDDDDNFLRQMFNVGNDSETIVELATDVNDELPYPQVNYPGGENQMSGLQIHDFTQCYEANTINGVSQQRLKGGNFPCGLIAFDWFPAATADPLLSSGLSIQIDLVPGNHRGYLCEPMTEM